MTAAPMTAAAYRGVAPRGCAASSFRITLKTLESATARRNAQNVLIAVSTGDASGGIRYLGSPIGVRTPTGGLAWEGDIATRYRSCRPYSVALTDSVRTRRDRREPQQEGLEVGELGIADDVLPVGGHPAVASLANDLGLDPTADRKIARRVPL